MSDVHLTSMLAGRAKGMMAERLAVSEAKLMKLHHDEVIKSLVEIKMELAQSRFEALELQVTDASCCPCNLCCQACTKFAVQEFNYSWLGNVFATCFHALTGRIQ